MATNPIQALDFDEILSLFQEQLVEHMNSEEYIDKYNGLKLVISKEQQFMKIKDKDPNAIYIVVQFGSADILFGQTVLPVTINALTEQNNIELAYDLFYEYSQKYNLVRVHDDTINQVYESPSMAGNFNELWSGFRGVVTMSAAYVIGKNSNEYKVYYYYTENGIDYAEETPIISATYAFVGSPDTQAFYNNHNYVKSQITFGGMTIGFSAFILTDSKLMNDILSILGNVKNEEGNNGKKAFIGSVGGDRVFPLDEIPSSDEITPSEYINDNVDLSDVTEANLKTVRIFDKTTGDVWKFSETIVNTKVWIKEKTLDSIPAESFNHSDSPVNKTFKLGTIYADDTHARVKEYKLTSASSVQEVGQLPMITLAFTE